MLDKLNYRTLHKTLYMKLLSGNLLLTLLFLLLFNSCLDFSSNQEKKEKKMTASDPVLNEGMPDFQENINKEVFYGLYSPTDISNMLEKADIHYEPSFFLSPEQAKTFTSAAKISMNLGVYGADFSLNKLFDNLAGAIKYMKVISQLAKELNIPPEILSGSSERMDKNQNNADSLSMIAFETYNKISDYLTENDRESSVGLILMGAWVEGLYLATNYVYADAKENPRVIERIIEQKYSLNYLMTFLKNYYDDPQVAYYYRLLGVLNNHFENLMITYKQGEVKIDTLNKFIKTQWSRFEFTREEFDAVQNTVQTIREIITET